jgi:hypothetical protein
MDSPLMTDRDEKHRPKGAETPPGDFLSDDLRDETARFLNEVKRRIKKDKEPKQEPRLGPPPR